jgi:hypothetical protein
MATKPTTVTRSLVITSATQVTTVLTIVFATSHFFKVGDTFTVANAYLFTVDSVTNATTITVTVSASDTYSLNGLTAVVPYFSTGQTGLFTTPFTLEKNTGIVQFIMNGSGGATLTVSGSLDKNSPLATFATVTLPATLNSTEFITIQVPWTFLHFNISSIGANSQLKIIQIG